MRWLIGLSMSQSFFLNAYRKSVNTLSGISAGAGVDDYKLGYWGSERQ